ncbi:MAG: hypothetical protein FK733_17375 [Asgard group archaeon]|nr:hypothetical protein [Asgard group archaeon]
MVNNKKMPLIIIGLLLSISGGTFASIYVNRASSFTFGPIIAAIAVLFSIIGIVVIVIAKKRAGETKEGQIHTSLETNKIRKSKRQTCYWCGFPVDNHSEFCSDCGRKLSRCTVCKLNISIGDVVGKCSYCESVGHFTHLFEWVKTKGTCPYCLQKMPTDAIIEVSNLK